MMPLACGRRVAATSKWLSAEIMTVMQFSIRWPALINNPNSNLSPYLNPKP